MSVQTIIDLDVLVPADKKVSLGGAMYTLPGDMPMETYLRLQHAGRDDQDEGDMAEALREALFDLFTYKVSDDDEETRHRLRKTLDSLGIRTFLKLFSEIYKEEDDEEETPDGNPTQAEPGDGTTSSSQKPTTT